MTVVAGRLSHIALSAPGGRGNSNMVSAMHSLAALIGADRPGSAAILCDDAELNLKKSLIAATAMHGGMDCDITDLPILLRRRLAHADAEVRVSIYRFLAPMSCRPWFVSAIISERDLSLLNRIVDVHSEHGLTMQHWRHAVVLTVKKTMDTSFVDIPGNGAIHESVNGGGEHTMSTRQRAEAEARQMLARAVQYGPLRGGEHEVAAPVVAMDTG